MHPYDIKLFKAIKQKWLDEFKITEEQLFTIFTFCFGAKLDELTEKILGMSSFVWKTYNFEIRKAIKRTLPKLGELEDLQKQRENHQYFSDWQDDLSGYNLGKTNGVWKAKNNT